MCQYIIVDKRLAKANEQGEICVKGPNVMMGYYKNEEKTHVALKDGYLYTFFLAVLFLIVSFCSSVSESDKKALNSANEKNNAKDDSDNTDNSIVIDNSPFVGNNNIIGIGNNISISIDN